MDRLKITPYRLLLASFFVCATIVAGVLAQNNPFAPQKAPPLPAGMTGADTNDPRAKLTVAGMWDAGEVTSGMKHIALLKKPDAFMLPSDPNDAKVTRGAT